MIYAVLAVISLLAVIAGIILLIVGLSIPKPKLRNAGIIIAPVCIVTMVLSFRGCTQRVNEKLSMVGDKFKSTMDSIMKLEPQDGFNKNKAILKDTNRNSQVNKLKAWLADDVKETIPDKFYVNQGTFMSRRAPLIFPYAITEGSDVWSVVNEYDTLQMGIKYVFNVEKLNYDNKFMLFQTKAGNGENDEKSFILFEMKTQKSVVFNSYSEMLVLAKKKGYKNFKEDLISVEDYYLMFSYDENEPALVEDKIKLQKQIDSLTELLEK